MRASPAECKAALHSLPSAGWRIHAAMCGLVLDLDTAIYLLISLLWR